MLRVRLGGGLLLAVAPTPCVAVANPVFSVLQVQGVSVCIIKVTTSLAD